MQQKIPENLESDNPNLLGTEIKQIFSQTIHSWISCEDCCLTTVYLKESGWGKIMKKHIKGKTK